MFLCYCAAISEAYSRIAKSFTGIKTNLSADIDSISTGECVCIVF